MDRTPRFGWQREVADALVCDISAVAVDWLPTGKPLVVTRPGKPLAPILSGGMLSQLPLLGSADRANDIVEALAQAGAATNWPDCTRGRTTTSPQATWVHSWLRCSRSCRLTPHRHRRNSRDYGYTTRALARGRAAATPHYCTQILAEDATFHSPVLFRPQQGRDLVALYLTGALHVIANPTFRYVREVAQDNNAVLEFETEIDEIHVNGVDIITWDEQGLISDFKVMLRPLKALNIVQQRMAELLEQMT